MILEKERIVYFSSSIIVVGDIIKVDNIWREMSLR